ncbi:MAG: GntR family transcriptional regulator [Myxococcales bacterium]|nr:GntR family transcriptional regulator [Myxococcales bacterium]
MADFVFDQLAAAILRGELPAQSPLPPERVFAERFGVSRIIVRQAVHRLADLGLVRVRQGGGTMVLDPDQATDLRLLGLYYRLAPDDVAGGPSRNDMIEKQYLQGLSMVSVAARRASPAALERVARLVDAYADGEHKGRPVAELEEQFWRAVAKAGGNRIFVMEVAWWYEVLRDRPVPAAVGALSRRRRAAFYVELARRLVERDHPVEYYAAVMAPILDRLFARRRAPA